MFHGRTVNTEMLKTKTTNKGQLITMMTKVPRESPCHAVKLCQHLFEISIIFGFKGK